MCVAVRGGVGVMLKWAPSFRIPQLWQQGQNKSQFLVQFSEPEPGHEIRESCSFHQHLLKIILQVIGLDFTNN